MACQIDSVKMLRNPKHLESLTGMNIRHLIPRISRYRWICDLRAREGGTVWDKVCLSENAWISSHLVSNNECGITEYGQLLLLGKYFLCTKQRGRALQIGNSTNDKFATSRYVLSTWWGDFSTAQTQRLPIAC